MKDKIMVCFDKAQRETALQLQNVIDTMVSAAGISLCVNAMKKWIKPAAM